MKSPIKNMAYWKAKNTPAKQKEEEHFLIKKKKMPQEGMVPHMGYVHGFEKTKDNPSGGKSVQLGWKDPREGKGAYHYYEKHKKGKKQN